MSKDFINLLISCQLYLRNQHKPGPVVPGKDWKTSYRKDLLIEIIFILVVEKTHFCIFIALGLWTQKILTTFWAISVWVDGYFRQAHRLLNHQVFSVMNGLLPHLPYCQIGGNARELEDRLLVIEGFGVKTNLNVFVMYEETQEMVAVYVVVTVVDVVADDLF